MTGQIAGPSVFSLELVGLIIGVSMIVCAIDLIRQPGWAWKRAEESKIAYLALVILVPLIGLALYVFSARPKVATIAAGGRAASLPFERFAQVVATKQHDEQNEDGWPPGTVTPIEGFGSFGAPAVTEDQIRMVEAVTAHRAVPVGPEVTSFSPGGTATQTGRPLMTLPRSYSPQQRTSLTEPAEVGPPVLAGWKADPTGRHQFRYWDGFQWTENVSDAGHQSRDSVSP